MAQTVAEKAIEAIKKDHPKEAETLSMVVKKDVVALGTHEAFALRSSDGDIRAFKGVVRLSLQNGGLVQPVYGSQVAVVSAQGYEMWAEEVGANAIFPQHVLVGAEYKPNPYVERDPQNGRILNVYARAIAFKYSPKGLPQVCDWTTIFDVPSYRLIDLLAKAKKTPQAFRLLPSSMEGPGEKGTWAHYPFDEATSLWINTAHEDALTWYAQILNREKKSIDFAQTFARRNAFKHLSGLQKSPDLQQWNVPVISWRPTGQNIVKWDAAQYTKLQASVEKLTSGGGQDQFEAIELVAGKEDVDGEEFVSEAEIEDLETPQSPSTKSVQPEQEQMFSKDDEGFGDEPPPPTEEPPAPTKKNGSTQTRKPRKDTAQKAMQQEPPAPEKERSALASKKKEGRPLDEVTKTNLAFIKDTFSDEYAQALERLQLNDVTTMEDAESVQAIVDNLIG